ncbi:probable serine/threonine-protein kinase nek3 isoform X1 [Lethenteron reissneri]|uniref:probable serine/threonine-protein kinase nek3 isoform X1 n=1 Tax=Lethenteron reissneri TaxID=7753 RepID=UPI002AB7DB85|nr:probable serine/threonine-protein kinase nek3 isoform X1 [Lethenteron reissneri]XP_061403094.1 probable serine/threonine-protein kinase nek3 isoform X1 [Lethenteron reissneri]
MEAHGLRSTSRTLVALLVTSYAFLTSGPTEEKNFSPNWLVNLGGAWEVQPPQAGQPLPLAKATVAVHISDRLADHEAKREPRVASSPSHGVEVPQGGGGEDDDPAPLGWKTFMEMLHSRPVAIAYEVASAGIALLSLGVWLKNAVWRPRPPAMPAMAVHTTNLPKQKARSNLAEMVPQAASSLGCWMTVPQDGEYPSPSRWTTLMKMLHSGPVAITYHVESTGITITSLRVWRKNQLKSSQRGRIYRSRHMRGSMWKLARGKRHPMKIKRTHRSLKTRLDGCSMMNSSPTLNSAPTNSTTPTNTSTPTNSTTPTNTTMTNPTPTNIAISTNTITLSNTTTSTNAILTNTTTSSNPTNPTNNIFSTFTTTRADTITPAEREWCHLMIMARTNARCTTISSIIPTSSTTNSPAPTNSTTSTSPTPTNITSSTLTTTPSHITPAEYVSSLMIMREKRSLFMARINACSTTPTNSTTFRIRTPTNTTTPPNTATLTKRNYSDEHHHSYQNQPYQRQPYQHQPYQHHYSYYYPYQHQPYQHQSYQHNDSYQYDHPNRHHHSSQQQSYQRYLSYKRQLYKHLDPYQHHHPK